MNDYTTDTHRKGTHMQYQTDRQRRSDEGFTLIELLIVIVILGILAAVVVFSVSGIQDRGEDSALAANVRTVEVASEAYLAKCGDYAPSLSELLDPSQAECPGAEDLGVDGFLKSIPGVRPVDGDPDTFAPFGLANAARVTYNPVDGSVDFVAPSGSTGGGTTTTTTAPPTLSINVTSPAAGPVSATVTLVASGTLVTSVQFQVDGANVGGVDNSAPFEATWDTTTATNGAHNITAIANGTLTSDPVAVNVNNVAPVTIAIATPAAGNVSGTVNLTAAVTGSVTSVEYFYGSTSIGTSGTAPYTVAWNTTLVANGPYALTAVADGTVTSNPPVNVNVNNACAYFAHTAPATLDIDMDGNSDGDLLAAAAFSFQTTGACSTPMSIRINRPGGGTIDVTPMAPNTPSTGPATWSFTIPANSNTWDNFGATIGTGTLIFRSNGVQIPGSATANINFGSTNAPCTFVSLSGASVDGNGDIQVDRGSGGGGTALSSALAFSVNTVGNCSSPVRLQFDPPGSGGGNFKDLSLAAPAAAYSGGPRAWSGSYAAGDNSSGGWGNSNSSNNNALVVQGGGGGGAVSNGFLSGAIDFV